MSSRGDNRVRAALARESARIMYEEEVKQYFTAKRMAARRMFGRQGGRRLRYRPADLPSNGEIRDALLELAEVYEGDSRQRRLFTMRVVALEAMEALVPFRPRLIGSVASGHVRRGSDVDLHVFCDDPEQLEAHLATLHWSYEAQHVSIRKGGEIRDYLHYHVADLFPLELTVYDTRALRERPRSSTDGKPIIRLRAAALAALMAREHPDEWAAYCRDGTTPELEELLQSGEAEGAALKAIA